MANKKSTVWPNDSAYPVYDSHEDGNIFPYQEGFTKREVIAKDVLCALITNGKYEDPDGRDMIEVAIHVTDGFIKALNNTKDETPG